MTNTINDKIIASGYCNRYLGEDSIDYKIRVDKLRQLIQKETPAITTKPVVQTPDMSISVCTFNDGLFQIMIKDKYGYEVMFEGTKKLESNDFEVVNKLAPACVFTPYKMI